MLLLITGSPQPLSSPQVCSCGVARNGRDAPASSWAYGMRLRAPWEGQSHWPPWGFASQCTCEGLLHFSRRSSRLRWVPGKSPDPDFQSSDPDFESPDPDFQSSDPNLKRPVSDFRSSTPELKRNLQHGGGNLLDTLKRWSCKSFAIQSQADFKCADRTCHQSDARKHTSPNSTTACCLVRSVSHQRVGREPANPQ